VPTLLFFWFVFQEKQAYNKGFKDVLGGRCCFCIDMMIVEFECDWGGGGGGGEGGGAEELAIEADSEILIWETLLLKA